MIRESCSSNSNQRSLGDNILDISPQTKIPNMLKVSDVLVAKAICAGYKSNTYQQVMLKEFDTNRARRWFLYCCLRFACGDAIIEQY